MTSQDVVAVKSWDHAVLPAMDLWRAERFYSQILGGSMFRKSGVSFKDVTEKAGAFGTFITFGRQHMGFFLQSVSPVHPPDDLETGCPCVGMSVAADDFEDVIERVRSVGVTVLPERTEVYGRLQVRSVRCTDSEGNCLELVADDRGRFEGRAVTGLSHLHAETLDLESTASFYARYLGFGLEDRGEGWMSLGLESGQWFIFHHVKELSPAMVGPYIARHFAFHVDDDAFRAIVERLGAAGIDEGDLQNPEPGARPYVPPRREGNLATYFHEPSRLRLQLTNQDTTLASRDCPRLRYVEE